jgi:hypothetical protein
MKRLRASSVRKAEHINQTEDICFSVRGIRERIVGVGRKMKDDTGPLSEFVKFLCPEPQRGATDVSWDNGKLLFKVERKPISSQSFFNARYSGLHVLGSNKTSDLPDVL